MALRPNRDATAEGLLRSAGAPVAAVQLLAVMIFTHRLGYPLVISQFTIENGPFIGDLPIKDGGFS